MAKLRIPAKPDSVADLLARYGSEEGIVQAFLDHQLTSDDHHVLSPTWMANCLLRRVLEKLDEMLVVVRQQRPL